MISIECRFRVTAREPGCPRGCKGRFDIIPEAVGALVAPRVKVSAVSQVEQSVGV